MARGDAFALDLARLRKEIAAPLRGKYAVVWSLGAADTSRTSATTRPHSRLVISDAVFDTQPTLAQLERCTLTPMVCEYRALELGLYFVEDGPLPRGVTLLGQLASPPEVPEYVCYGAWSSFALIFDLQWRHLHERDKLAAQQQKARAATEKLAQAAARKRRAGGLEGMKRRTQVAVWTKLVPAKHARAVRAMISEAIADLAKTPAKTPAKKRLAILEALVERINAYNDAAKEFIDTPEREALLECLEDLAAVSGLGSITAQLDEWRDW